MSIAELPIAIDREKIADFCRPAGNPAVASVRIGLAARGGKFVPARRRNQRARRARSPELPLAITAMKLGDRGAVTRLRPCA